MNILHYTIGLPLKRSGGSVRYAYDLMQEQAQQGHGVYALVCGDTLFRAGVCRFKKRGRNGNVEVVELSNPLTPPLIYGVSDPKGQYRRVKIDCDGIRSFIDEKKIEVLHLHTMMGLHRDIVAFIKSLGVKVVYTTHDFHGICPHYSLIKYDGTLCKEVVPEECLKCNLYAPSDLFLRVVNSPLYSNLKRCGVFRMLGKRIARSLLTDNSESKVNIRSNSTSDDYRELLDYYRGYFSLIDIFHFNSGQTRDVFTSFFSEAKGRVIPIVTSAIKDNRRSLRSNDYIRIGFIGSLSEYKGFPMLKQVLIELCNEDVRNLRIDIYGCDKEGTDNDCLLIEYHKPYSYLQVPEIMCALDGVVVPSKCYETFSLVVLESFAYGRLAIVSDHVGAKDIVAEYAPSLIFSTPEQLKKLLKSISINPDILTDINSKIIDKVWKYDISSHSSVIVREIYGGSDLY